MTFCLTKSRRFRILVHKICVPFQWCPLWWMIIQKTRCSITKITKNVIRRTAAFICLPIGPLCSPSISLSVFLTACPFVYPSRCCSSVFQPVSLCSIRQIIQSSYPSIHPSFFLSVHLFVHLFVHLSICLSIYLSICLSVYLSVCLSVSLSICLYHWPPVWLVWH